MTGDHGQACRASRYPPTREIDHVDVYHGVCVADPYRWLEDEANTERATWIAAQRAVTEQYLAAVPGRDELRERLRSLLNYSRVYGVMRRGGLIFFTANDGVQEQPAIHVQRGINGPVERLVDPAVLVPSGTARVTAVAPSRDGRYLAYGLSRDGSDWEEYRIKDVHTRCDLPDRIQWIKYSAIAWSGSGFYYSRYPAPTAQGAMRSDRDQNHQVWYHRVAMPQSTDTLIYEDRTHPHRLHVAQTTEDEAHVLLLSRDYARQQPGNALLVAEAGVGRLTFVPIVASFADDYQVVDNVGRCLLVLTNHDAPNGRLVLIDPTYPEPSHWVNVVRETAHRLDAVVPGQGKLFVTHREHGTHRVRVADRTGKVEHELALPSMGMVQVFRGARTDADVLWSFSGFTEPPTIYRHDVASRTSHVFNRPSAPFDGAQLQAGRVFYLSKDGTRVPMFIVHRKGLALDGSHPLLLYGYGGNGISVGPRFDPLLVALLERGVVYAMPCLRGGAEYGDAWHRDGWRERKQNVFDDCIAAAEWLYANGYSSRDRAALSGSSNGGLMVGAVMTQRPDLFRVALPDVGIMDMLRFQEFSIGPAWAVEYGLSDDPVMFPSLLAYSPLHNVREGVTYPATLVTTSEHDDHVVPAHSFKFVAALQARGAQPGPYLIRIDSESGHGPVNVSKALEERVDVYAFLLAHIIEPVSQTPRDPRAEIAEAGPNVDRPCRP